MPLKHIRSKIWRSAIWRLVVALIAVLPVVAPSHAAPPQPPVLGHWLSEGRDAVIEIFPCGDDTLCGRLTWFAPGPDDAKNPPMDGNNPDLSLRFRPLCGLVILKGFKPSGEGEWNDGSVYDPDNGKTYRATMTLVDDGTLRLRGYIGIPLFGETQAWTRAAPETGTCAGLADP
jgi:uncharacterized protein (DUF2147 family)